MDNNTSPTTQPSNHMVFTMGLPASGKSFTANLIYGETHQIIDPDAVKEAHPDYDPKNPQALHAWSQTLVEAQFDAALENGGSYLVDGTGTNAEKMVRRINDAKAAGFTTHLVYVTCSLETSLRRNSQRERVVPTHVITSKARDISTSFEIVRSYVDTVEVIDNENAF